MNRQQELMAISESKTQKRFVFTLKNPSRGFLQLRYAPDGWESSKFLIERNATYYGLTRKVSVNELTFVKDGRDFIRDVYESEGITGRIVFQVTRLSDSTHTYVEYFTGLIDMSTYVCSETGVSVSVIDSAMHEKLKNRETTTVNLRSLTSIEGYTIPPFTNEVDTIFLPAFNVEALATWVINTDVETTLNSHYVPLLTSANDFAEAQSQDIEATDPMFLASVADRTIRVGGNIEGYVSSGGPTVATYDIVFQLYSDGVIQQIWPFRAMNKNRIDFDFTIDEEIAVTTGEDISLRAVVTGFSGTSTTTYTACHAHFHQTLSELDAATVYCRPFYECLLRTLQIILDDNDILQSEFFGRTDTPLVTYASDGELGVLTKGLFVRGADAQNTSLPVSFKELFKSLSAIFQIGVGIESVSGTNKVVIEDIGHFFAGSVIIDLSSRVREDAIEKEVLPEWHYSHIKVGYDSFTYEISGGLLEYNTTSKFTTVVSCLNNELDLVSKYRADTSGITKLRQAGYSGEDVEGDNDIFMIDAGRNVGNWLAITSQNMTAVTGGPDADEYYNLEWTPKRNLLRHGSIIRAMLCRDLGSSLRWESSDKNTLLTTQLTTETAPVDEDADITAYDLDAPYWYAEAYNLECYMTYADLTAILANPNGLIKLSDTKYGWILKLEIGQKENKAKMKLLRCNTTKVPPT